MHTAVSPKVAVEVPGVSARRKGNLNTRLVLFPSYTLKHPQLPSSNGKPHFDSMHFEVVAFADTPFPKQL